MILQQRVHEANKFLLFSQIYPSLENNIIVYECWSGSNQILSWHTQNLSLLSCAVFGMYGISGEIMKTLLNDKKFSDLIFNLK